MIADNIIYLNVPSTISSYILSLYMSSIEFLFTFSILLILLCFFVFILSIIKGITVKNLEIAISILVIIGLSNSKVSLY